MRKVKVCFAFDLARVWQHFQNKQFGIVSAYKSGLTDQENEIRGEKLKQYVRSLGYGYKEIYGVWKSTNQTVTIEYPLLIPNLKYEDALAMGRDQYLPIEERRPQEAVIIADHDKIQLVLCNSGEVVDVWSKMEVGLKESWEAWSELKGRSKGREWKYASVEWGITEPPIRKEEFMSVLVNEAYGKDEGTSFLNREFLRKKYEIGDKDGL